MFAFLAPSGVLLTKTAVSGGTKSHLLQPTQSTCFANHPLPLPAPLGAQGRIHELLVARPFALPE